LSYAKSLRNALKDKNETLYNRLQPIENDAKSVLTYTAYKFPYYTPHNFLHSQNVEDILNWLVPDDIKSKMTDHEIFFLLIAAWLHDWGMVASARENAEEVRKLHHIRTEENFERFHDKIHLSLNEVRLVGRLCRGHRDENLLGQEYDDSFFGSNILVRIRFLAALLRIADECDVTANRTPEIVYWTLKPEGASEEEFQKHLSIPGIGNPAPYKLVLSGVAKTPKGVEVIEGVRRQIQKQLDSVRTILAANGVLLDIVEPQIVTRGFINKPIAFELDRNAIVDLLIGRALYSRKDAAIRELLQNALDTCRFQKIIDNSFIPKIEIEFDKDHICFKDNGVGMNFEDASKYFSRKGSSFYVSKEYEKALNGRKFDPISRFGIGVLSSFLVADQMIIETKKENCAPCMFKIADLAEGWTYEEGGQQESGTEVTLLLNDRGRRLNVTDSLKHYAKNVEVPIYIKNLETGDRQKLEQKWGPDIPEVFEQISEDERDKFVPSEPFMKLGSVSQDLETTFHVFRETYFDSKNCFLLSHGIYVGNFDLFPAHGSNWISLMDLKSRLVNLTVSRESLMHDDKYSKFLEAVYDAFLDSVNRFVNDKFGTHSNLRKCIGFSAYMNGFFRSSFGVKKEDAESLFLSKVFNQETYAVLTKDGLVFLRGDDISPKRFSKIIHYSLPTDYFEEHVAEVCRIFSSEIKDGEAIVFDPGPLLQYIVPPRKFICGFCDNIRSKGITLVQCYDLSKFVSSRAFTKEDVSLDPLLPSGSFFTRMPDSLRGLVAQIKPFEFTPPLDTIAGSDNLQEELYYTLVAKELQSNDADVAACYVHRWLEQCFSLRSPGQFVYDIGDKFLAFLNSKAEVIFSNENIKKLIERYLRLLAIYYLEPRYSLSDPREEATSLLLLEKTAAEMLGYTKEYVPITKRMGKLVVVYKLEAF
jgi:hypothetical protein